MMKEYLEKMKKSFDDAANLLPQGKQKSLNEVLDLFFLTVIRVNLVTDTARLRQSVDLPEYVGKLVNWTDFLKNYSLYLDTDGLEMFHSQQILERYHSGQTTFSKEVPYTVNHSVEWLTVEAICDSTEISDFATITVRRSSREHLLKSIFDLYVYNNCDYFLYIDARHNRSTMFSKSNNMLPQLPSDKDDYTTKAMQFADDFVVSEDRDMVKYEMTLPRILDKLEHDPAHSFTCGIIDLKRGYTRKRMEFRYCDRQAQMILLSCTDITDIYLENLKKQAELQRALHRASTDSLTGILNHQGIIDRVTACLQNEHNRSALLVIDLDNFKIVNDTYGHIAGDELLRQIAEILQAEVRSNDLVGRIGGDEFLVFLRGVGSVKETINIAQRLCNAVFKLSSITNYTVSCSIGIAISPDDGTDCPTLIKHADRQAYHAKFNGKNQISI